MYDGDDGRDRDERRPKNEARLIILLCLFAFAMAGLGIWGTIGMRAPLPH